MTRIENVVLGAGVAGLAAAHAAREAGGSATIFEARARHGGTLDHFEVDGFRFDHGVHLSFATEPAVRAVFDQTPYETHDAVSLNFDDGFWLKHPAQNNMFPLPVDQKVALIAGLAEHGGDEGSIANYRDWLIHQYGEPIATRWPLVYTEKYWTVDAAELGTEWIGKRMRRADLREVLGGAFSSETPNTYYISQMRYPKKGGYRSFVDPLAEHADLRFGYEVTSLDTASRHIGFRNGEELGYGNLVSTLPLPRLIELASNAPDSVRADAATLFATELDLVSIGFERADVPPSLWFYIYDRDILAARAYSPSRKSADNAPAGTSSLQFEIYSSVRKPQTLDAEALIENCIAALERMGLATRDDIRVVDHRRLAYANVVFDLGMEARRDRVREWVASQGIALAGRFGEWDYLWSNQAFMSGLRAGTAAFTGVAA
jgi:protoporphyrinogen oxidase